MKTHAVLSITLFALFGHVCGCTGRPATAVSAAGAAAHTLTSSASGRHPNSGTFDPARLVLQSCADKDKAASDQVQRRIGHMRTQVHDAFESWRVRPFCAPSEGRGNRGTIWGDSIGESFGMGGLGLTGIGEGGGGQGFRAGHGSIGTLGHGANRESSRSGTNNQVGGVDEADFVKNDGAYVYVAVKGALRIVDATTPRLVSVTRLPGTARKLFVEGDRAVVYVSSGAATPNECKYGYDCVFAGDGTGTTILVMDIKDRAAPTIQRRIDLSGSLMAARRIGNAIHTVVADTNATLPALATEPNNVPWCYENEPLVRAQFERLERENEEKIRRAAFVFPTIADSGIGHPLCDVLRTPASDGEAFTTLVSFDMRADRSPITTATVQSRPGAVFASDRGLYVTVVDRRPGESEWGDRYERELSHVHKFRIGAAPGETRYVGTGVVPGHVLNQFSMDEQDGYLRVATTVGRVPAPNVRSSVSILTEVEDGSLVRVGAVDDIAPSEDIRAVRFDGDRAYVVTFKKTDPLFVLDLRNPKAPKILGELKIPGFSTYLHRIDPTHLLSIGFDANDHGDFAFFDGILLQIFDVTNPTRPVLLHREKIGTRGSSSEAATDHLAFNYLGERNLLAIPTTLCDGGGDGSFANRMSFSGLLVYRADVTHGFRRLGGIDHGRRGADCNTWWSNATSLVKRSIFMDDLVYSIALDRMKVQHLGHLGVDVADIRM